jgi:hypothetical protein
MKEAKERTKTLRPSCLKEIIFLFFFKEIGERKSLVVTQPTVPPRESWSCALCCDDGGRGFCCG